MLRGFFSGQASKFVVAVLGALGEAARTGHFDWKSLVAGMIAAVAVYLVPNSQVPPVAPVPAPKEPPPA